MSGLEAYRKINDQAVKLVQAAIRRSAGNVLFSPLNLMTTLMMAAVGARGKTLCELAAALGIPGTGIDLLVRQLLDDLAHENGRTLLAHYAAWFAADVQVAADYARALETCFDGRIGRADFSQSEATAAMINAEIARHTCGMLRDVVSPSAISEETKLMLLGTLYFGSPWEKPFDKDDTEDMDFHLPDKRKKRVPMMFQQERLPYFRSERDGVHGVILPCKKSDCEIVALMPVGLFARPLPRLIGKLDEPTLAAWLASADADEEVKLYLPRFSLTQRMDDLKNVLEDMGIATLFTDAADLSGIAGRPLKLDKIVHAVCLEIDEDGARAAAATVMCCPVGAAPVIRKVREFKADRPFMLLIRHKTTGLLLFAALIEDPS